MTGAPRRPLRAELQAQRRTCIASHAFRAHAIAGGRPVAVPSVSQARDHTSGMKCVQHEAPRDGLCARGALQWLRCDGMGRRAGTRQGKRSLSSTGAGCAPRRLSRHARQTALRRFQARTSLSSAASAAWAMQPRTSAGSAGSRARGMLQLCRAESAATCLLRLVGSPTLGTDRVLNGLRRSEGRNKARESSVRDASLASSSISVIPVPFWSSS